MSVFHSTHPTHSTHSEIELLSHWLLTQGPIKDFIHHNTLHAYQDRPFHDGVRAASRMYGARGLLPVGEYRSLYRAGRITESALDRILTRYSSTPGEIGPLREQLIGAEIPAGSERIGGLVEGGLRSRWTERGIYFRHQVHPAFFRMIGGFLDQGVAPWRIPNSALPLFQSIQRTVDQSWFPLPPFDSEVARELLALEPAQAIETVLARFVSDPRHFRRYLAEMLLDHPGWSGMVHMIESQPENLVDRREISLLDFCALELIAEYTLVVRQLGRDFRPITVPNEEALGLPVDEISIPPTRSERLQEIWHEAFERSYYEDVLAGLSTRPARENPQTPAQAEVQVYFCIDDRECSLRRHLESVNPKIETYGVPGFFAIDCVFQGEKDAFPHKHCPAPVRPRHLIREVSRSSSEGRGQGAERFHHLHLENHANTFVRGWLITQTLGLTAAFKLAFSLFRPTLSPATASALHRVQANVPLEVHRVAEADATTGYQVGYTFQEMADRVAGLLRSSGVLARPLASLIVLFGHGASSVNNPYFAAYDCGACSGKPGAPNARAFALMANHPQVRTILGARGIVIPDTSWFVGAVHDTTRDEVQYYDLEKMPDRLASGWGKFSAQMGEALTRNAKERCRRFYLVPLDISGEDAHREVRRRSIAIFEPRPELNHATNAACIVGRRSLTRGLFLDRRAFMNSYDPTIDPKGEILTTILSAVVPVCGGINLEYFFSRVDSSVYGAGSKLPHNVNGLIGVTAGTEGDLLMGLPTQMTEIHDPIRLMLVIEHDAEIALASVMANPAVYEWIRNRWMNFFSVDPASRESYEYIEGRMVRVNLPRSGDQARVAVDANAILNARENIRVARTDSGSNS